MGRFKTYLAKLPRLHKRLIILTLDLLCLLAVLLMATRLRGTLGADFVAPESRTYALLSILPFLSVVAFYKLRLYHLVTRHIGAKGFWRIGYSLLAAIVVWTSLIFIADWRGGLSILPRTVVAGYWLAGWFTIWLNRQAISWWLRELPIEHSDKRRDLPKKAVMVYGAGDYGQRLLKALRNDGSYRNVGYIDDEPSLWGMKLDGFKVHPIGALPKLLEEQAIQEVFIALPTASRQQRRRVVRQLESYPVQIKILPDLSDLISGEVRVDEARAVDINDLLGRDPVAPIDSLIRQDITGKSVLVTGAGGSIGSEIVRQIVKLGPKRLVLLDLSEFALYTIEQELLEGLSQARPDVKREQPAIIPVLGSVGDERLLRRILRSHSVDSVYHAAAYKHIPLLEDNLLAVIENNVLATHTLAEVACACGVDKLVLISSDKAVRPTNVKGAGNRIQELILQAKALDEQCRTSIAIVRFGNVLDSSGSVVPKFREQIRRGGPVTVTHPDVVRYFMSIPEAAQLVIQAGAMAKTGEIYVLDMGKPVKIDDLARTMIRLSGKILRDDSHPDGDIAIQYIGLRPGDKMHEELLIEGNVSGTRHPFIMRMDEPAPAAIANMRQLVEQMEKAVETEDYAEIIRLLQENVSGFEGSLRPGKPVVVLGRPDLRLIHVNQN